MLRAGAPIVPVGIDGTYAAWPRWSKRPFRGRIAYVRFGEPIELGAFKDRAEREAALPELERVLREALMELSGESERARGLDEEVVTEIQESVPEGR